MALSSTLVRPSAAPDLTLPPVPRRPEREADVAYLIRLAEVLHTHGTPAHRLEESLVRCAERLRVPAQFHSSPTSLFLTFGTGLEQRCHLLRVEPGEANLGKLASLFEVIEDVETGALTSSAAIGRIDEIAAAPPRYHPMLWVVSLGVTSACAARLFGGGAAELVLAAALSLAIGAFAQLTAGRPNAARLFNPFAAVLAAFLAHTAARVFPPFQDHVVTLSALIFLIPGLSITIAMTELATQHLVSGTARLAGSLTLFMTLGFGVAIGRKLATLLPMTATLELSVPGLPAASEWVALLLTPFAFTVLFHARLREAPWILAVGLAGFQAARYGSTALGPELGAFLGAFVVGLSSNAYARLLNRPASVVSLPGILLLVPGSIGFEGVTAFLAHDVVSGVDAVFKMALVAVSLVGGVLLANGLGAPRRSL